MATKFFIAFLISFVCYCNGKAQTTENATQYQPKILEGYFVLVRDSIPKTDSDVKISVYSFDLFFLASITDKNIECLQKTNYPSKDSIIFVSGDDSYIADSQEHKHYINWLIKNNYFEKADHGVYPSFDYKKIPSYLVNNKKQRFISVYKGKCTVVGPFYPYNKLQLEDQKLFMCLPVESNTN